MSKNISREAIVWIFLLTITGINWVLFDMGDVVEGLSAGLIGAILLLLTFFKAWLVIDYFMEVREAPRALRAGLAGWTILSAGSLMIQVLFF